MCVCVVACNSQRYDPSWRCAERSGKQMFLAFSTCRLPPPVFAVFLLARACGMPSSSQLESPDGRMMHARASTVRSATGNHAAKHTGVDLVNLIAATSRAFTDHPVPSSLRVAFRAVSEGPSSERLQPSCMVRVLVTKNPGPRNFGTSLCLAPWGNLTPQK